MPWKVVRCLSPQVPFSPKKLKIRVAFCIIAEIDRRAVPIGASQSDEKVPMAVTAYSNVLLDIIHLKKSGLHL